MRISIRKPNRLYLERLSAQMEVDPTEAINYLLIELKRIGYSFNADLRLSVSSKASPSNDFEHNEPELGTTGSLRAFLMNEAKNAKNEDDPVIERFVSLGLDQF